MDDLEIFAAARELDPEQRAAYLDRACGDDVHLREHVERLLGSLESAGSFLEAPASPDSIMAATLQTAGTLEPNMRVGPYKLRERIGEGGMGEVYVAEQTEPLRRKVALKVIKPGMASKQIVARFEAERQALALMDHPHVAKVLDGGTTPTGQPFFVMELVRGVPITEYCDQQRLSARNRLQLFLKVCGAVQHAHLKGIIHRDLKPSNVLVPEIDGEAVPKVIDFGVAKAVIQKLTEETLYTQFTQVVGTPLYMSPEQAGSGVVDIDTRSDVYSLGVLLYELLTGHTPFDRETLQQSGFDEFRRILREEEPRRPSDAISTLNAEALSTVSDRRNIKPRELHQLVCGELDWIVMKALEKDRSRRYESASALAADIQCHLNDEPVQASPPSKLYQAKKFARRHRIGLAICATVSAAVLVGVCGLAVATALISRERNIAENNFHRARETVDKFLTDVSESQLLDTPSLQPLRKELLEAALQYYEQFIAERGDDPSLQVELADGYYRVGTITSEIGSKSKALEVHRQGLSMREQLLARSPTDMRRQYDVITSTRAVSELLAQLGDSQEATPLAERAVSAAQNLAQQHQRSEYVELLARCLYALGYTQSAKKDFREAQDSFEKSLQVYERLADGNAATREVRYGLANAYCRQREHQKAIDLAEELLDEAPNVLEYRFLLGQQMMNLGIDQKGEQAFASYQRSLAILEELVEQNPEMSEFEETLAILHRNIAGYYVESDDLRAAAAAFEEGIQHLQKIVEKNPQVVDYKGQLTAQCAFVSELYSRIGDNEMAEQRSLDAVTIARSMGEEHYFDLAHAYRIRGTVKSNAGRPRQSIESYRSSAELLERLIEAERDLDPSWRYRAALVEVLGEIATLLTGLEQHEEAARAYESAIQQEANYLREFPDQRVGRGISDLRNSVVEALTTVSATESAQVFFEKQLATWEELRSICQDRHGVNGQLVDFHTSYAKWLKERGDDQEAEQHIEDAIDILREELALNPNDLRRWNAWTSYALNLYRIVGSKPAEQIAASVMDLAENDASRLFNVAPLLLLTGRHDEYRRVCAELLDDLEAKEERLFAEISPVVRMCGLDPDSIGQADRVLRLAQEVAQLPPPKGSSEDLPLYTLGRALYRAGRFDEAVKLLHRAFEAASNKGKAPLVALDVALAYHYWGRASEASNWLDTATQLLEEDERWIRWGGHVRIQIEVLRREAERLIPAKQQL